MPMLRQSLVVSLMVAAGFASAPAFAQFQKPEDQVKYRQGAFTLMGNHMGRINAQLKADKPDVKAIAASAAILETVAVLPFEAFGKDTALPNSKAKPEIWSEGDKFDAASKKMTGAVDKLNAAAKGGDVGAIKAAFGDVGGACKNCHDTYRAK